MMQHDATSKRDWSDTWYSDIFRPKSEHNSATRRTLSSGTTSSLWRITLRPIYRSSNLVSILNPFMLYFHGIRENHQEQFGTSVPVILRYVGPKWSKNPRCFRRLRTVWPVTLSMILGGIGFLSEVDGHVGYRWKKLMVYYPGGYSPKYSWFDT